MRATLAELTVAADPEPWRAAGFAVDGSSLRVGRISIELAGRDAGRGIVGWRLRGLGAADVDGLPTQAASGEPGEPAPRHDNAVVGLDHVVAFSPDLERTIERLRAAGLDFRRVREGATPAGAIRQAFFVVGDAVLEVIEHPPGTPQAADRDAFAHFYGLAFVVDDLDACAARMGDLLGEPRAAIQPGRRIATARREAGLGPPVAFMTPRPEAAASG
jgi:hypothetical protein